jgi:predicted dehydrogenase
VIDRHFRIAENFEVEPAFLAARDVIRSGAIGDVAFFRLSMVSYIDEKNNRYYNTAWRTNPEYQGGGAAGS